MSEYGITANGFVRKRLAEIKSDLEANLATAFGVAISTKPNSGIGQLVGVAAASIDDLWQVAEDTYNAMYPNTATGTSLDGSAGFAGVTRLNAAKTKIYAVCYGISGTTIPKSAQIQGTDSSYYAAYEASEISLDNAVSLILTISGVTSGSTYSVTIAGTTKSYTAGSADTVNTVLVALTSGLPTGWSGSVSNNVLTLTQTDRINGAVASASTNLTVSSIGSPIVFYAVESGDLDPAIGTVSSITTQIAGWNSVSNESAAYPGRSIESDIALRLRHASTVSAAGTAMIESIKANLEENVSGVTTAIVFENPADSTDSDGRPAHSIEAVVLGGDEDEITAMIWQTKAAGINTYGSTSRTVTDSQGVEHTISFNRPTEVPIHLKCVVHEHAETGLSGDATQTIADYLLSQGNALGVGDDVILQKLAAYILQNVAGISYIELTGSTDGTTFSATNIAVGVRSIATFTAARIEVTVSS